MTCRLAYLTGEYPRATDTFIQREVSALRGHGVQVSTFSVRQPDSSQWVGPEQREEASRTIYVQDLARNPFRLIGAHLGCLTLSPARYLRAAKLAWRSRSEGFKATIYQAFYFAEAAVFAHAMRKAGVGHLHNHFANSSCSLSMLASEISGIPFSFTLHGPAIFFEPHRWRLDMKLNRAKRVACISHFCRSQAMIFADPARWDRLGIIHCGIDPALFESKRHHGSGTKLVTIGRLAPVKGMHVLIESLGELRERNRKVELTLIGDGPERERLQARVNELGLERAVHFTGYQSQSQVRDHLLQADVYVSSSFAEGVPVVLMEAMAGGLPCIATRIAGVPELVEHERTGLIVSPGDRGELTDAIDRLLGDAGLRQRFAEAGREKVEREFNIHTEAGKLIEFLGLSEKAVSSPDPADELVTSVR